MQQKIQIDISRFIFFILKKPFDENAAGLRRAAQIKDKGTGLNSFLAHVSLLELQRFPGLLGESGTSDGTGTFCVRPLGMHSAGVRRSTFNET